MNWSTFGKSFGGHTGIGELMADLGGALALNPGMRMMGGGNPAHIPEVEKIWRSRLAEIAAEHETCDRMLGNYGPPRGNPPFLDAFAEFLRKEYGWPVTSRNLAVTNGGQTAFFYLLNLLAGRCDDGVQKKILLPLMPEYIGYADQSLSDFFVTCKPRLELLGDHGFKYHIDFDRLQVTPDVGAICVSRPNNPTGNVLTDAEIKRLSLLAAENGIPLVVDNAYGAPFPHVIFTETTPAWDANTILTFSLSKLGLPGTRTGIVLASEEVASAIASINAVVGLATGNVGQELVRPMLANGDLARLSRDVICPFYREKSRKALGWLKASMPGDVPYRVHVSEGAFFLWLWFEGLPITARELYGRLKERGVLVVPGSHFFYGMHDPEWKHPHECIRVTFSQSDDIVREGLALVAEEARAAYTAGTSTG